MRRGVLAFAGLLLAITIVTLLVWTEPDADIELPVVIEPRTAELAEGTVRRLCSHCHNFPEPNLLPSTSWQEVILQMSRTHGFGTGMSRVPSATQVIAWYQARAPQRLKLPALAIPDDSPLQFTSQLVVGPQNVEEAPFVSHVQQISLGGQPTQLAAEMRSSRILARRASAQDEEFAVLADVPYPARVTIADLDRDGRDDLLVACLGSFVAMDHSIGSVEWLQQKPDGGFARTTLADGLGRVADVQPTDIDGDGDLDLLVSEFGWRTTGRVLVLENRPDPDGQPEMVLTPIDGRAGALRAVLVDVDSDGRPDPVAFYGQQTEALIAYQRLEGRGFRLNFLFQAPHPAWGSTGAEPVDLDGDGDVDWLMTNGDTFDDGKLKPWHGVRWLESHPDGSVSPHLLTTLFGAHAAIPVDLDQDGDLDVVACAMADVVTARQQLDGALPVAVMWLEQTSPATFLPHRLVSGPLCYTTIDAADVDGDGDPDLILGRAWLHASAETTPHPVEILLNQGVRDTSSVRN